MKILHVLLLLAGIVSCKTQHNIKEQGHPLIGETLILKTEGSDSKEEVSYCIPKGDETKIVFKSENEAIFIMNNNNRPVLTKYKYINETYNFVFTEKSILPFKKFSLIVFSHEKNKIKCNLQLGSNDDEDGFKLIENVFFLVE